MENEKLKNIVFRIRVVLYKLRKKLTPITKKIGIEIRYRLCSLRYSLLSLYRCLRKSILNFIERKKTEYLAKKLIKARAKSDELFEQHFIEKSFE